MKIERSQFFGITSILDRNGKRVANYLVDKSKDSLNKERKNTPHPNEEEAVVIHHSEPEALVEKGLDVESKAASVTGMLDITV
jgi:hypothetical protein